MDALSNIPIERQVQDLVAALTDDSDQSRPGRRDFEDRVFATWDRMERASPRLGSAVLELLDARPEMDPGVRSRLLEAAARSMTRDAAAREELAQALQRRVESFDFPMGERNKASELIGDYSPEQALAVLQRYIVPGHRGTTTPDHEFMLRGFLAAAKSQGRDVQDVLCAVAGDPSMTTISRVIAFDALSGQTSPLALATMEAGMVESTGDSYTRRAALRSYVASVDKARAIARIEAVLVREADSNFQIILQGTLAQLRDGR